MHITLIKNVYEYFFLFVYFYLVKFSCQNAIFIYLFLNAKESYETIMEKNAEK